ncbi:MAG: geranylgeranyl reductase family protein [Deltaproteobacteria bacterium]|nr:geranylgeranyl reductase family protein [Deltaproteobacteria bacterium]
MRSTCDVLVVGAGPGGAVAALQAVKSSCGTVMLVDKAKFPRFKPCGGGLSPRSIKTLKSLGLWSKIEPRAYPISALRLVSPNGREATLGGPVVGAVMNRYEFDQILVRAAADAGAILEPETKVDALWEENGRVVGVCSSDRRISAKWVVIANGALTAFNEDPRPKKFLHTCLARFENIRFQANTLEMFYDLDLLPHYGWLFPESASMANIGICIDAKQLGERSIRNVFRSFLDCHFGDRLGESRQIGRWYSHPISTTTRIRHESRPGTILVGEANRLTNVATGEGISYAMESGILAVRMIDEISRGITTADQASCAYQARLRKSLEINLIAGDLYCRFGVKALNGVTRLCRSPIVSRLTSQALAGM